MTCPGHVWLDSNKLTSSLLPSLRNQQWSRMYGTEVICHYKLSECINATSGLERYYCNSMWEIKYLGFVRKKLERYHISLFHIYSETHAMLCWVLWAWISHIHIEEALLPKHVHKTDVKKLFEKIWTALPCCNQKCHTRTIWKPCLTIALSSPHKREVLGIVESGLSDILGDWVVDHVDYYGEKDRELSMRLMGDL